MEKPVGGGSKSEYGLYQRELFLLITIGFVLFNPTGPKSEMELRLSRIKSIEDIRDGLAFLTEQDRDLARAFQFIRTAGVEIPLRLRPGGFGGLVEIVISQLVSKASARAIHQRFEQYILPLTPKAYLDAGVETWRIIGLSRPKQTTLSAVATAIISGDLEPDRLGQLPVEEAMLQLTAIKGIGTWSAEVYLLFCLGHQDIFPAGDLALREAARLIWCLDERPSDRELKQIASKWSPWRGVAARLLWAYYATKKSGNKSGKSVMPL